MTCWIALLRGINVGRTNRLPMADLRSTIEALGCRDVATYIQSGNVVFEASPLDELDEPTLASLIGRSVGERHGLDVPIVLRTAAEIARIAGAHPDATSGIDPKLLHVMFLDHPPLERCPCGDRSRAVRARRLDRRWTPDLRALSERLGSIQADDRRVREGVRRHRNGAQSEHGSQAGRDRRRSLTGNRQNWPWRPSPPANRVAPSTVSPDSITARPSSVSFAIAPASGRSHCS